MRRPILYVAQILEWADAHFRHTGSWPTENSGRIPMTDEKWINIAGALRLGFRGLPGNWSLPQLLFAYRGKRDPLRLPPLSVKQILAWADAFYSKHERWPTRQSGQIDGTDEKWGGIDQALRLGTRRLPGGSSLAMLLHERRGARHQSLLPKLSKQMILEWADAHHEQYGEWPAATSGRIAGTAEDWTTIDRALRRGYRGLRGKSSLAMLLEAARSRRNSKHLPPLRIRQILGWADAHHARTGKWPHKDSGPIAETEETWLAIDAALRHGRRGLPAGSSLPELLRQQRGVRNRLNLPRLSLKLILEWADAHFQRTGNWPSEDSGPVVDAPGETWKGIESALRQKCRGLRIQSTLARVLTQYRGKRHSHDLPPFKISEILKWADAHCEQTGKWPTQYSGAIAGTQETWSAVQKALQLGRRSLPGGSSIACLLHERRRVRHRAHSPQLSVQTILAWADAHHERTGNWPRQTTGTIPEARGETWSRVDRALRQQARGLRVKTTLAELLYKHRGVHRHERLPVLSLDDIQAWAESYRKRTGRWPTRGSGAIPEAPGESWSRISNALTQGKRGITAKMTLAEFLTGKRRCGWLLRPLLSIEQILAWADAYFERHGSWPSQSSGPVSGASGEDWGKINNALRQGNRGLPAGSSLFQLLRTNRRDKPVKTGHPSRRAAPPASPQNP